jgi:hypothetical protein
LSPSTRYKEEREEKRREKRRVSDDGKGIFDG